MYTVQYINKTVFEYSIALYSVRCIVQNLRFKIKLKIKKLLHYTHYTHIHLNELHNTFRNNVFLGGVAKD